MSSAVPQAAPIPAHADLERPSWACVLHAPPKTAAWWPADDGFVTCQQCDQGLRERLREVAARYLQLDVRPGASFESGARGAPGFGSKPPLNLHVVCLRDPRSSVDAKVWMGRDGRVHAESERPPLSVHGTLSVEAWSIAEHRGVEGPGDRDDVHALVRFVERHLSYAARHAELVAELDRAVRDLLGQLRPVTGDGRKRVGRCPTMLRSETPGEHGEFTDVPCAAPLLAPLAGSDDIRCYACGAQWGYGDWLALGNLLMAAQVAAQAVRAENAA